MGGTVKAWKQKVSTWIKTALIIAGVTIVSLIILFLGYKAYVGYRKSSLRNEIARLQAQVSDTPGSAAPSQVELAQLALLSKLVNNRA